MRQGAASQCQLTLGLTQICFVGNVMIDTLLAYRHKAERSRILDRLGLTVRPYAVCTLHRPSNVDDKERFLGILEALQVIGRELPIIYPLHPRTQQRIQSFGLSASVAFSRSSDVVELRNPITCLEPLGYLDFLQLMANARLVLTDSGGIQEETTILGIPCVTIRENTERPVTISEGTNILGGVGKAGIIQAAREALNGNGRAEKRPEKWDGQTSVRIVDILLRSLV